MNPADESKALHSSCDEGTLNNVNSLEKFKEMVWPKIMMAKKDRRKAEDDKNESE